MTAFRPHPTDLATALSLLSRLPVPPESVSPGRMAAAAWTWPLAGAIVGGLAALVGLAALRAGLPAAAVAGLVLAAQMLATGAMHEDGLADTADGLWGGSTAARRLEIMQDSRTGSFGVLALIVVTGLRWAALTALVPGGPGWALIASGALSRMPMVSLARRLPPARPGGLSAATGAPPRGAEALALAIALALGLLCTGAPALVALPAALGVSLWLARLALHRIGGQTGDILGAAQQLAEAAVLLSLAAAL